MMSATGAQLCALTCLFACSSAFSLTFGSSQIMGFTFLLPAGQTECFYQTVAKGDSIEVNYQVIAGQGLDVSFFLFSPSRHPLLSDVRRSDGIHIVDASEDGDHRLCFDNSHSKLSQKMIVFEVTVDGPNVAAEGGRKAWVDVALTNQDEMERPVAAITAQMDLVHQNLEKSRQSLAALRAFEARDRYLLEDNLWRVSFWSCVNLLVMSAVAVTQIYTLRRLFDDKRPVRT
ncbi:transmembrane emp24 domain-containing protein 1-like [Nelusetta ayraudi]|uniref:transmembrane emp24 domain-containing protein 1-like n=1 Tax=Nelusetta ayraudi TaxID=303726 RepID=UPI003F6E8778